MRQALCSEAIIFLITLSLLFGTVLTATAQEPAPTTDPAPETQLAPNTERPAERREAVQGERRAQLTQNMQNRIVNLSKNIENRLRAATNRIGNIIARIESRIQKIESAGVDVSRAKETFTQAKNTYDAAVSTLAELESTERAISSDTPRESFGLIRTQYLGVRDLLRQTHALLGQTIMLLKEAGGNKNEVRDASGTSTVN